MKKLKFILLFLIFLLVGCRNTIVTKDTFLEVADFNGYIIKEDLSGYEKYTYIKSVYYAINREGAYDIQFLELENDEYAKNFFELNKSELMKDVDSDTYVKNINNTDYSVYHIETDSSYKLIIRSRNSIIYLEAPIEYILEIEEFLEELDINY